MNLATKKSRVALGRGRVWWCSECTEVKTVKQGKNSIQEFGCDERKETGG